MFDPKSDYALNKKDREAIVYRDATGTLVRLTVDDFSSEAEFLAWKELSDADYHEQERAGRSFNDHCIPLIEALDPPELSVEDILIAAFQSSEQNHMTEAMLEQLRDFFTETQIRRLRMFYADGLNVTAIAKAEGVSKAGISISLQAARKKFPAFCAKMLNKLPF